MCVFCIYRISKLSEIKDFFRNYHHQSTLKIINQAVQSVTLLIEILLLLFLLFGLYLILQGRIREIECSCELINILIFIFLKLEQRS